MPAPTWMTPAVLMLTIPPSKPTLAALRLDEVEPVVRPIEIDGVAVRAERSASETLPPLAVRLKRSPIDKAPVLLFPEMAMLALVEVIETPLPIFTS